MLLHFIFFLLDNTERLSRFFPLTFSSNKTIEKSVAYIEEKNDEIERKVNFTFAIKELDSQKIAGFAYNELDLNFFCRLSLIKRM